MTHPIVELAFWNPGDARSPGVDALLADPRAPLVRHGLTGIAAAYARDTGAQLCDAQQRWADDLALRSLAVDGALAHVVPVLRRAGIPFFVAKGPTIAYVDYPDPGMRPYTDLDVYAPPEVHCDAVAVLQDLGYDKVPQVVGPLGGLPCEYHGGPFGTTVELHSHVVDNFQRRWVAPVAEFLRYTTERTLCGVDVPMLELPAHVALQAIHLGAGHRYQKLVLYRDLAATESRPSSDLGADYALEVIAELLHRFGVEEGNRPETSWSATLLAGRLAAAPSRWDEHRLSIGNVLGLLGQAGPTRSLFAGAVALRGLVRQRSSARARLTMGRGVRS